MIQRCASVNQTQRREKVSGLGISAITPAQKQKLAIGLAKNGSVMPLNKKGLKIREALEREYGKTKGKSVFYAMENAGKIKGVVKKKRK